MQLRRLSLAQNGRATVRNRVRGTHATYVFEYDPHGPYVRKRDLRYVHDLDAERWRLRT